jgi:hypothetical protein
MGNTPTQGIGEKPEANADGKPIQLGGVLRRRIGFQVAMPAILGLCIPPYLP